MIDRLAGVFGVAALRTNCSSAQIELPICLAGRTRVGCPYSTSRFLMW